MTANAAVRKIGRAADRIAETAEHVTLRNVKTAEHAGRRIAETAGHAVHRDKMQDGRKTRSRRLTESSAMIRIIPLFGVTRDRAAARIRRTHKGISPS